MLGLEEKSFCAYLQPWIPERIRALFAQLVSVLLFGIVFFLSEFSGVSLEADSGPSNTGLAGTPSGVLRGRQAAKFFCSLCGKSALRCVRWLEHPCMTVCGESCTLCPALCSRSEFLPADPCRDAPAQAAFRRQRL